MRLKCSPNQETSSKLISELFWLIENIQRRFIASLLSNFTESDIQELVPVIKERDRQTETDRQRDREMKLHKKRTFSCLTLIVVI